MGSILSSPIGQVIVSLTPADNLNVGSYELIYNLDLTKSMFKKKKTDVSNVVPSICLPLPQLGSSLKQLSIEFQFNKTQNVGGGRVELTLTRNNEVIQTKQIFEGSPTMELSSGTFGYKIANQLVNLAQVGDVYQIRIFLN
jgi:hypothetical protein